MINTTLHRRPAIRRLNRFLSIVLVCMLSFAASAHSMRSEIPARNVQFNQLTIEDGLSQGMIYDVAQDGRGFVWIATQEGLNRYDGYQVQVYEHLRNDATTLSNDFIWSLLVDSDGVLWVGTGQGVNRYDAKNDRFDREPFSREGRSLIPTVPVHSMVQTRDGSYWFGTGGEGLFRVADGGRIVQRFAPGNEATSLPDDTVLSLLEDRKGDLWIGTENAGLYRFDAVTERFMLQGSSEETSDRFLGRRIRALYEGSDGFVWIGSDSSGASRFDPRRGRIEQFRHNPDDGKSIASDKVRDVLQDTHGTIWLATDAGLSEWREEERGFVNYRHDDADPRSLINDRLQALMVDASGVLWVGSWKGLSRWNYLSDTFTYFRAEEGMLPGNLVSGVAESRDGSLWVATYGTGIAKLNPMTGEHTVYRHDPADPRSLPDDRVMTIYVDPQDRVWVGTRYGGLAQLDQTREGFERYQHDPEDAGSLSGNAVSSIFSDATGWLWVGTYGEGLNRFRPDTAGGFERFTHDPADPSTPSGDRILSIAGDGSGGIFIGTFGAGLNRYDPETGHFQRYLKLVSSAPPGADPVERDERILETVADLILDRRGVAWLATIGDGLVRVDRFGESEVLEATVFTKSDGLPSDTYYGMLPGQEDELWLSGNRGLLRFEPDTGSVRHFDTRNGLRLDEFNNTSRVRSRTGQLLFGGPGGLVGFYPGELPVNTHEPNVVLSAHSREARIGMSASGEPADAIELSYIDQFVAFDFVALDFTSPDKNQYRYMLEGFDPEWIDSDEFRRAVYTNLPSGDYSFRVQAANNDGVWNDEVAEIRVNVIPAPWKTWWAYLGYVGLASAVVWFFLRAQRQKLRRESQQRVLLEQEVSERTRELALRNRELEQLNDRLAEASVTDSLTGLRNRRYVDQFINSEVSLFERSQAEDVLDVEGGIRESNRTMFFMMIDLDGFKLINDEHGHQAGDAALIQVKDILQSCSRESDTLVRWGGDEFMVIGFSSGFFGVKVLAERIRDAIASHHFDVGHGEYGRLSASIGIAPYPLIEERERFCSWEMVVGVADQAAYVAKASGRNAWVSLSGTEKLDADKLQNLKVNLATYIDAGLLHVDSSLDSELVLPGDEYSKVS